jgi:hypothetical protein
MLISLPSRIPKIRVSFNLTTLKCIVLIFITALIIATTGLTKLISVSTGASSGEKRKSTKINDESSSESESDEQSSTGGTDSAGDADNIDKAGGTGGAGDAGNEEDHSDEQACDLYKDNDQVTLCDRNRPCSQCTEQNLRCRYTDEPDEPEGDEGDDQHEQSCQQCLEDRLIYDFVKPTCGECFKKDLPCMYDGKFT